jgi:hypothetical protein
MQPSLPPVATQLPAPAGVEKQQQVGVLAWSAGRAGWKHLGVCAGVCAGSERASEPEGLDDVQPASQRAHHLGGKQPR